MSLDARSAPNHLSRPSLRPSLRPDPALRSASGGMLRLDTLVRVRWLAVGGQAAAILFVGVVLGFPLPMGLCFALIAASAWLNVALRWIYPNARRLGSTSATLVLGYDVVQLAGLLYLTGGLENPFAFLMVGPVIAAAATLPPKRTLILGALVLACASALAMWHMPLPWYEGQELRIPLLYVAGIWVALTCCLVFMGVQAHRVTAEARELAAALSATELVLAREHHLHALDGLSTAAAHELGTPLSTIALASKELEREMPRDSPFAEDVALIRSQTRRCRDILGKLASLSVSPQAHMRSMPLSHIVEEVTAPHRGLGIEIDVRRDVAGPESATARNPALLYGLGNILENAVDFAREQVEVEMFWDARRVRVTVSDDGPGFSPEILERLGEPYVTSRRHGTPAASTDEGEAQGLGLGFFIAKTLLERSGARLSLRNRKGDRTGAVVAIEWPRERFEAARDDSPPS